MIIILIILLFVLFGLVGVYTTGQSKLSITSKSRFLEVVDQNDQVVGYLLGSLHTHLEKDEMEPTVNLLNRLLPTANHVFLECIVGHWAAMPEGLEKALLRTLEKSYPDIQPKELESLAAQRAMLSATYRVWDMPARLPLQGLFIKYPAIASTLGTINRWLWFIPNLIYGLFVNPGFNGQLVQESNAALKRYRQDFLAGQTSLCSNVEADLYEIVLRDKAMYETLSQSVGQFSHDNLFIALIGNLHLSVDAGLISRFESQGFVVRPMNLDQ